VSPDGSSSSQTLGSGTATSLSQCTPETPQGLCPTFQSGSLNSPDNVIPDGQGGSLATWGESPNPPNGYAPIMVTHVSPTGSGTYSLPIEGASELALGENGVAFASGPWVDVGQKAMSFDMNSGQVLWTYESAPGTDVNLVAATADGGMLLALTYGGSQGLTSVIDLISVDSVGAPVKAGSIFAAGPPAYSWSQQWYAPSGSINLPVLVDSSNMWATPRGNASESGFAAPLDPSSFQSTDSAPSSTVCPTCQLKSPNCNTMPGILPTTYLILVGDPGLNVASDPARQHNLGDLLNLAAQQKANDLNQGGAGNWVTVCRVSSIQDFEAALTEVAPGEVIPGQITGGVYYFGHSATQFDVPGGVVVAEHSILAPGQGTGQDTNIGDFNVLQLHNTELGPNASITLNGCNAGAKTPGYRRPSIAQLIALQLQRPVFAYDVGVYFSHEDADHDSHYNGMDLVNGHEVVRKVSWGLPMYALPEGVSGHKPRMTQFKPH
jgi:hypothetical protein